MSVLRLTSVLLRRHRFVLLLSLGSAALAIAIALLQPRTYTSGAVFAPQSTEGNLSRLAGIATQFGLAVPTEEVDRSPAFYVRLLQSRELLEDIVTSRYPRPAAGAASDTAQADLTELLDVAGGRSDLRIANAIQHLRDHLKVLTRPEAGVVEYSVTTPSAELSEKVASRMLQLLERFNVRNRQSRARAERAFIAERLDAVRADLAAAEESLQSFLEQNRRYENSPRLRFEHDRLNRRVVLQQQLYDHLAESYEEARIEEVRNTPLITIVDSPAVPAEPDPRRLVLKALVGLMIGGMLAAVLAILEEALHSAKLTSPREYEELADASRNAHEDLRTLTMKVRGLIGHGPK